MAGLVSQKLSNRTYCGIVWKADAIFLYISPMSDGNPNWPKACETVLLRLVDNGQAAMLFVFGITGFAIWRMPREKVGILGEKIVDAIIDYSLAGYLLFALTLFLWFLHSRHLMKSHKKEIARIGEEKSRLQRSLIGTEVKSSQP